MMRLRRLVTAVAIVLGLGVAACGDDGEGGVCIYSSTYVTECFDCWTQKLCEESSARTWNSAVSSCAELGYTTPSGNNCGYTK